MRCTECGREIGAGQKFCGYCGTPVIPNESGSKGGEQNYEGCGELKGEGFVKMILIFTTVTVFVLVGFMAYSIADSHGLFDRNETVETESEFRFTEKESKSEESISFDMTKSENEDTDTETLDNQTEVNDDKEHTDSNSQWEQSMIEESNGYVSPWVDSNQNSNGIREYILPESDSRYISESELMGLTAAECSIARNELYARHGRKFKDEGIQNYFNQFDWYIPLIEPEDFKESVFNVYEIANRDLIVRYEKKHGYN